MTIVIIVVGDLHDKSFVLTQVYTHGSGIRMCLSWIEVDLKDHYQ